MRRHPSLLVPLFVFSASATAADVDKYLLDDTDAVLGLNVKLLLQSPLVKKNYLPLAQKQLKSNDEAQKLLQELGLDPFRDVDRVLLVHGESCHRTVASKEEFAPLVIIRGRFDPARIHAKAAQLAQFVPNLIKFEQTKNGIIYEIGVPRPFFVALPDRTALVASLFKDQVAEALLKGRGKKERRLKHFGMEFLVQQVDYKNSVWVAAQGRAAFGEKTQLPIAKGKKVEEGARKKLSDSGIEEISGGLTVTDGIRAKFHIKVPDPETAKTISDLLPQILPQIAANDLDGKLEGKRFDPVREFLRSLVVGSDDNYLIVRGEVSGKVFAESLK